MGHLEDIKERVKERTEGLKKGIKSRVPLTEENQERWREEREHREEMHKAYVEGRRTAEVSQASERGKASVTPQRSHSTRSNHPQPRYSSPAPRRHSRGPSYTFHDPMMDNLFSKPKPKQQQPVRTVTTSRSGSVTVKEYTNPEAEAKKKQTGPTFRDPFEITTFGSPTHSKRKGKKHEPTFRDPFEVLM